MKPGLEDPPTSCGHFPCRGSWPEEVQSRLRYTTTLACIHLLKYRFWFRRAGAFLTCSQVRLILTLTELWGARWWCVRSRHLACRAIWAQVSALGEHGDMNQPQTAVLTPRFPLPAQFCSVALGARCHQLSLHQVTAPCPRGQQLTLGLGTELDVQLAEPTLTVLRALWGQVSPASSESSDQTGLSHTWHPCPAPTGHTGRWGHQCLSYTPGHFAQLVGSLIIRFKKVH